MKPEKHHRVLVVVLLLAAACTHAAAQDMTAEDAWFAAHDADAPLRNLVYLLLRVAGVAWVAVEWIAAAVLLLAYRKLYAAIHKTRKPDHA